jgi:hypothetical protein
MLGAELSGCWIALPVCGALWGERKEKCCVFVTPSVRFTIRDSTVHTTGVCLCVCVCL